MSNIFVMMSRGHSEIRYFESISTHVKIFCNYKTPEWTNKNIYIGLETHDFYIIYDRTSNLRSEMNQFAFT